MADTKISALPASTTPLAGTEVLPIVQSGATKQVSIANLTAGRALSATEITLSTGNLIIGTSGKGIDFSATSGAGTSELLADYEEGTWTPDQGPGFTVVGTFASTGTYTKVGRLVTVTASYTATSLSCGTAAVLSTNLPFTVAYIGAGSSSANGITSNGVVVAGSAGTLLYSALAYTSRTLIFFTVTYIV